MATIFKRGNKWRAQVRIAGQTHSQSFDVKTEAQRWARNKETELDIARGTPAQLRVTLADVIDAYTAFSKKEFNVTKQRTLERWKETLGNKRIGELTKKVFLDHAQSRENEGAGPCALATDFTYISVALRYGGVAADVDEHTAVVLAHLSAARSVLTHAKRLGPGQERSRRPTEDELDQLAGYFHSRPRLSVPMWDLCLFAIATAMRAGEITRIAWEDFDEERRMVMVRDRKDPKKKDGNDMDVPLLKGPFVYRGQVVDPVAILMRQRSVAFRRGAIFPHQVHTITSAFERACDACKIDDLTFHDFRHDAISRLFEYGYKIEEVALVSGHKSWRNLQRYTHLRPQSLHRE